MSSYVASGGLRTGGCVEYIATAVYPYKYSEGSVVYVCEKARRHGVMEAVGIKRVILHVSKETYYQPIVTYVDFLNGTWIENELCSQAEARAMAIAYQERALAKAKLAKELCLSTVGEVVVY